MSQVKVQYGDKPAETAQKLLDAAEALDQDASVVETTSDGVFLVPEDVADEAGVDFDKGDDNGDGGFDASDYKGKELDAALEERGLSTEGKADEKRARLAEFEDNKE